jgi:hypothetical protein
MPGITGNLIQGEAILYRAPFGTAEPAQTTAGLADAPGVGWEEIGFTTDSTTITVEQEYKEMEVQQITEVPESRLVKQRVTVETSMAEATLENLKFALNGGDVATASAVKTFKPVKSSGASQPTYSAIIIDGYGPGGVRRRIILRKVLSVDNTEFAYAKEEQTVLKVTLASHWVSDSIDSFDIHEDDPA